MGILSGSASCPLCNAQLDHGATLAGGRWQVENGKLVPSKGIGSGSKPNPNVPDYSDSKPVLNPRTGDYSDFMK